MRKILLLSSALAVALGLAASASANQVGAGSNAGTIVINANGTITFTQALGTYDGADDVVYNVINHFASPVTSLGVSGNDICDFDLDGINNYANPDGTEIGTRYGDGGVSTGIGPDPDDYAGYNNAPTGGFVMNHFTNVLTPAIGPDSAIINFGAGGILNGGSSFFSLEAETGIPSITLTVNPSVPLPASVWSGLAMLIGLGAYAKFSKPKVA